MPPLQITVVVSDRVGDLVKGRNTASQSQLLRAQESVLRTLPMTLRAPAPLCRSAERGTTFIVGELISYAVDFSGDPGSCLAGSAPAARCGQRAQKRTHTRRSKPHRGRDFILLFKPPYYYYYYYGLTISLDRDTHRHSFVLTAHGSPYVLVVDLVRCRVVSQILRI